jgi:hypothetical protein
MEGQTPAAGWHPDPHGSTNERYWDGQRWTDQIRKPPTVTAVTPGLETGEPKSTEERKRILADRVAYYVGQGYRPESQTDFQAVLVSGRRPNHLLHFIIGLVTLGLWWIFVWLPLAIFGGEKRKVVSVDEYGRALETKG